MSSARPKRLALEQGLEVVRERRPARGRRLFVGDIQGCKDELVALLEAVDFRPGRDRLYPVGDLVNRGPKSAGTLRLLMRLEARAVLGNHDLHLLGVAHGQRELGHSDTLDKLLESDDSRELLTWLARQPLVRIHKDLYQVHAGLHPAWTSPAEVVAALTTSRGKRHDRAVAFVTRARFCDHQGQLPSRRVQRDAEGNPTSPRWQPWFEYYQPKLHNGRFVVYGHWAQMGVVERDQSIGLDSGCVWGGALTGYIPEERLLVSVDPGRAYAGNFRPR